MAASRDELICFSNRGGLGDGAQEKGDVYHAKVSGQRMIGEPFEPVEGRGEGDCEGSEVGDGDGVFAGVGDGRPPPGSQDVLVGVGDGVLVGVDGVLVGVGDGATGDGAVVGVGVAEVAAVVGGAAAVAVLVGEGFGGSTVGVGDGDGMTMTWFAELTQRASAPIPATMLAPSAAHTAGPRGLDKRSGPPVAPGPPESAVRYGIPGSASRRASSRASKTEVFGGSEARGSAFGAASMTVAARSPSGAPSSKVPAQVWRRCGDANGKSAIPR